MFIYLCNLKQKLMIASQKVSFWQKGLVILSEKIETMMGEEFCFMLGRYSGKASICWNFTNRKIFVEINLRKRNG